MNKQFSLILLASLFGCADHGSAPSADRNVLSMNPAYFSTSNVSESSFSGSCGELLAINQNFSKSLSLIEIQAPAVAQDGSLTIFQDSLCSQVLYGPVVLTANQDINLRTKSATGEIWYSFNGQIQGTIEITGYASPKECVFTNNC